MPSTSKYDAIVIGAGHNGLVNGAYLAKSGLKTVILERRHLVGGAAITEELHPGFHFTTFSYAISLFRPDIIHELQLPKHGMKILEMPHSFAPMENGDYMLFGADKYFNYHQIARHSKKDAEAYFDFEHMMDKVCQAVKPLIDEIPPNLFSDDPVEVARLAKLGSHMRGLDKKTLHMLIRFLTGSSAEILDDYFESDIIKGAYASSGIIGSKVGPRSQGSGLVLLFHKLGEIDGVFGKWGFHKGGNGGFTQVLAKAAEALGAEIRLNSGVSSVITKNGRATGVVLENGDEIYANTIISALDPRRTFLQLVEPRELPNELIDDIQRYKFQGVSSKVNFALDGIPEYPALSGRSDIYRGFINIGPSIDYIERAFDSAKYGEFSQIPYIDGCFQSMMDPDMTPPGKHILSCFVQYTPYKLKNSDWDTERDNLGDRVQQTLASHFPNFNDLVLHREVVTPLDIERVVGLSEGNIFAGEFLAPQMYFFRPAPGWNQYRTPIANYYQCGSGTHPGGCILGSPGKLASQQIFGGFAEIVV